MSQTRFERAEPILRVADMKRSLRYSVDVLRFTNAESGSDDFTHVSSDSAGIYLCEGDPGSARHIDHGNGLDRCRRRGGAAWRVNQKRRPDSGAAGE
jgi:hypothetical protein